METTSDTLILSLKDNEELKAALGGHKPGDKIELCLEVTVTAVDDEQFEAAIDDVVEEDSSEEESETPDKETGSDETDEEDPAIVVMSAKK